MAQGRKMLGSKWDRIVAALERIDPVLTAEVVGYAYGEVYPRPGLDLRSRELMAITALTLQGLGPQLKTHVHAALEAGLSEAELMEAFLHLALYAGFPTALFGAGVAREALSERGEGRKRPQTRPGTRARPV
jgi:4-carboxymuconolactone decarboxylase